MPSSPSVLGDDTGLDEMLDPKAFLAMIGLEIASLSPPNSPGHFYKCGFTASVTKSEKINTSQFSDQAVLLPGDRANV